VGVQGRGHSQRALRTRWCARTAASRRADARARTQ
jgi:hypothetical protein